MKLFVRDKTLNTLHYFMEQDDYTPAANEEEVVDITIIKSLGELFNDYKAHREAIRNAVNAKSGFNPADPATYIGTNWAKLDAVEQSISSIYFVVPRAFRDLIHTEAEQIANGEVFHLNSVDARNRRSNKAISKLYNTLSFEDAQEVIDDVEDNRILRKYIKFGREGTVEGDLEGLFDYVEARTGTGFTANGFKAKNYTPVNGQTMAQLASDLMKIIKDGDY